MTMTPNDTDDDCLWCVLCPLLSYLSGVSLIKITVPRGHRTKEFVSFCGRSSFNDRLIIIHSSVDSFGALIKELKPPLDCWPAH